MPAAEISGPLDERADTAAPRGQLTCNERGQVRFDELDERLHARRALPVTQTDDAEWDGPRRPARERRCEAALREVVTHQPIGTHGRRPFRVHVDPSSDGAEVVNAVADRVRAELLRRLGLEDLLRPRDADAA